MLEANDRTDIVFETRVRQLEAANAQLTAANAELVTENGRLRVQLAQFEIQQICEARKVNLQTTPGSIQLSPRVG